MDPEAPTSRTSSRRWRARALALPAGAVVLVLGAATVPQPRSVAAAIGAAAGALAAWAALRVASGREHRQAADARDAAGRARLLRQLLEARADERRRLWEGLHDLVLQTTAGNLLRLDAARLLLAEGRTQDAVGLLQEAVRTERGVFDDLRRLMAEMGVEPIEGLDPDAGVARGPGRVLTLPDAAPQPAPGRG